MGLALPGSFLPSICLGGLCEPDFVSDLGRHIEAWFRVHSTLYPEPESPGQGLNSFSHPSTPVMAAICQLSTVLWVLSRVSLCDVNMQLGKALSDAGAERELTGLFH